MITRLRLPALVLLGLAIVASPLWGPPVLRRIDWFQVERVEISGTRLLAPHQVLAWSAVRRGQNVWDDLGSVESALRAKPAIAEVHVTRKLPATLRIRIAEKQPVAYIEGTTLEPATATGEILPLDPTRAPIDLPILVGSWESQPAGMRVAILGETGRLARLDPSLIAEVSEIRSADSTATVLFLSHRLGEIVMPVGAGSSRLAQLRAVLGDLETRLPPADSIDRAARIDLRFGEQIIVRLPSSVSAI